MSEEMVKYNSNEEAITVTPVTVLDSSESQITDAIKINNLIRSYAAKQLVKGVDYGTIPYCGNKPVLLKPGAEKLCRLFKLRVTFEVVDKIVDYKENIFHYHYRCRLIRNGEFVGEGDGLANSKEKKFNRTPFDYSIVNTICKMAEKRALVAAVLVTCGASEFFTQDMEDA